jgi:type II restriction/modification system DNA methylase subunit YeeA
MTTSELKSEQCARLVSFAIGCMMGRFSLGNSGVVLADSGIMADVQPRIEDGTYAEFHPDDDGIIPLNHREWFEDDATKRFFDFLEVLGGEFYLEENIKFIAEGLSPCLSNPVEGESSHRIIRRYINQEFYPQHLQYYSKRPIYWLLSSGKHRAFECLLYMHRYTEGTLARIRIAYIAPLIEKYRLHIEQLPSRIENASTMSQNMELQEELKLFESMQRELHHFDDKLNFYANKRIHIDLNDGVKYNHAKFEDLLAGLR